MVGPKKQSFWPKPIYSKETGQKLGMILENKVVQKLKIEKNGLLN